MRNHRVKLFIILGSVLAVLAIGYATLRGRRPQLTPDQAFEIGQNHLKAGRLRDAYSNFDYAARNRPEDVRYSWAAAQSGLKLNLVKSASSHARETWNRGLRNREVFQLLVSAITGDRAARLEKGLGWLKELPEGRERRELEGDLYQSVQRYPECLKIWTELYEEQPDPAVANKIALAWVATNKPEKGHEFLKTVREKGRLDEDGYGLLGSLAAYKGDAEEAAAIFEEGRGRFEKAQSLQVTQAIFLIWRDRLAEAAALLEPLKERVADPASAALHGQARILLGFLRSAQADTAALDALKALAAGEGAELEGERLYYQGLKEKSAETLKKARQLLPSNPACDWTLARELGRAGAWKESAEVYRGMSGLLAAAPVLQVEMALALIKSGRSEEALATLRALHARRFYTRASLEMLRDLASRRGLKDEAVEAQAYLEKRFGDDPAVAVAGGVLALQSGNLSEAAATLEALSTRHPDRDDVELARLSVIFARRDYEGVLKAVSASRAPAATLAPIQAASLVMLGRNEEAAALYERILAERREPATLLSYANLLLRLGRTPEAIARYRDVLQLQPNDTVAHLGVATAAVRTREWKTVRTHSEAAASGATEGPAQALLAEADLHEGRADRAVTRCARALALSPRDERAQYLFGIACLQLGRYDEADATLRRLAGEHPGAGHIVLALARVVMARGSFGEALAIVEGALERKLGDELAFRALRVALLAQGGRAGDAREQLAAIAPHLPPEKAALFDAWISAQDGKAAEAASKLRGHLQDPLAAVYWADLTLAEGVSEGVLDVLDRHALDAARWGKFGDLAREKGFIPLAAGCYKRALRLEPENPQLLNNFAYASLLTESFDENEVLAAARKCVSLLPGNASIVHTCASVLMKCRKERECIELLEKSPSLLQKTPRLLYAHASANEKIGQWGPALKSYEACLAHPETESVTSGDLSRASIQQRIDHVRARSGKP